MPTRKTRPIFFVKDSEHPYIQEKPFDWVRGYQVGGKSLIWARQTQRWSKYDFEGPGRDGFAVDWPIRYEDLALGTVMWSDLWGLAEIMMAWTPCRMGSFYRHGR